MLDPMWRGCFEDRILERGEKYWRQGRVRQLHDQGDIVTAIVQGTEDYDVEIDLTDGMFDDADCTCPYAGDGNACKHMAAVLFALEAGEARETGHEDKKAASVSWREALDQMGEQELRSLLAGMAAKDRALQERLILRATKELSAGQYDRWAKHLEKLARGARSRDGFIEYDQAYDFCMSVCEFLHDTASDLIDEGLFLDAFRLACMVYEFIQGEEMDDSDGGTTEILSCCEDIWMGMIQKADAEEKEQMYSLLTERLPDDFCVVEAVLMEADWDMKQLQASLRSLDKAIGKGGPDREIGRLVEQRRYLMERAGADKEQIQAYLARFHMLPAVRQMQIRGCIDRGDDRAAITLLQESKKLDEDKAGLVAQYSEQLAELYRRTGQTELYEQELRYLIFRCPNGDIEYVKQLKELTPTAQWPALFEQILRQPSMGYNAPALLAWDGQFQRLCDLLSRAPRAEEVDRYEAVLRSWSPEKTRDLYLRCLDMAMSLADGRGAYRKCIKYLRKLRTYPEGEAAVSRLTKMWRETYPRRRAMLDELERAGYRAE